MNGFFRIVGTAALICASIALTACGDHLKAHGTIVDQSAPEFRLFAATQTPVTLSGMRGKIIAVFFGYTHCGDVCPTTLAHLAQARHRLPKAGTPVQGIFITVDPRRDSPAATTRYARLFDPTFIGLSGSARQVQTVEHDFHVWAQAMPRDRHGNYDVSHSSELFLIAPDGRMRIIEDWDVSVADLTDDLRALATI